MRVVAATLLALAALVLVAAASARDPKEPQQRHTKADTALARSIALTRSDLTVGWKAAPKDKPAPPCSVEPDESKLVQTARIDPTFVWRDGVTSVGSEIDIFRTAAEARLDWKLTTLKLLNVCLLESARAQLGPQHVTVTPVSALSLGPLVTAERAFHFRIVFRLRNPKPALVVTDLVGVGVGRVSVVLHTFTVGGPLPTSDLKGLAATLDKRLVAALGGV